MSRIGLKPVSIPDKVQVKFEGRLLKAKGPKGELEFEIPNDIDYKLEGNVLSFSRNSNDKRIRALHGLSRALTSNVIEGVEKGFSKTLKIEGVGYKAEMKGKNLLLSLGFSHPIVVLPPSGIELQAPQANTIVISGMDKQLVGQLSAVIRDLRPPEPYKGKGIHYDGEYIRRKAGKTNSK